MDNKEGLRRIVKAVSVAAWVCLVALWLTGICILFGESPSFSILAFSAGIVIWAALQGIAWIAAGFSGLPKNEDGLIRFSDFKLRKKLTSSSDIKTKPVFTEHGIGGWLLLFCVSLILSAGRTMLAYSQAYDLIAKANPAALDGAYMQSLKFVCWTSAAIFLICYFLLIKFRNPNSIRYVIAGIWVAAVGAQMIDIASGYIFVPGFDVVIDQSIAPFFSNLIYAIVWTAYLLKSKRVKNTYGNQYLVADQTADRAEPSLNQGD